MKVRNQDKRCADRCLLCAEICEQFEKEFKNKSKMIDAVQLAHICAEKCKAVASNGCKDIHLLEQCAKACKACATESSKHEGLYALVCTESCLSCAKYCDEMVVSVG